MTNSLLIGKALFEKLSELGVNNLYPLVAENGTTYPYIIFRRDNVTIKDVSKDGYCSDIVNYTVITISDNYTQCVILANQVRGLLEKKKVVTTDLILYDSKLVSANERFQNDAYIQELTFECKIDNQ